MVHPRQSRPAEPKKASDAGGQLIELPAGDGRPECLAYVPHGFGGTIAPRLAICVHGISRDYREQIDLLRSQAERRGYALLAPHFDEDSWPDYQRLGRRGRGPRADLALDQSIHRLERELGLQLNERFLIGFSGGSQFVHRYVMAHPNRVRAATCAAAGWYTFPDPERDYPHGLRVDATLSGVVPNPAEFLRVPILTVVGAADTKSEAMRSSRKLDSTQGKTRVERGRRWSDAMARAAEKRGFDTAMSFSVLDGAGHAFAECIENGLDRLAFEFFDKSGRSRR